MAYGGVSNRPHLLCQIGGHDVHTVRQILSNTISPESHNASETDLPCASDTRDHGLPA